MRTKTALTRSIFIISSLAIFCVGSPAIAGKVYKWVDRNGKTHFSQTPPNGDTREYDVRFAKEKTVPEDLVSNTTMKDAGKNKEDKEAEKAKEKKERAKTPQERLAEIEKARAEQAKIATEKAKERDERIKKCQTAQSNMRNIEQGGRIYDVNKKGEREYWDDSKRAEKKDKAHEMIQKYCE